MEISRRKWYRTKVMIVAIIMLFQACITVSAADYLDLQHYIDAKAKYLNTDKYDGYKSNNGSWYLNYFGTIYMKGITVLSDRPSFDDTTVKATTWDVIRLVAGLKLYEKNGEKIDITDVEKLFDRSGKYAKSVMNITKNLEISRSTFCHYFYDEYLVNKSNFVEINSVSIKDVADLTESTPYKDEILKMLRLGMLELDAHGRFNGKASLKFVDLVKVIARAVNPYYRVTTSFYHGDKVVKQSDTFPMLYSNYIEKLFITVTKHRKYDTDYYVAKIVTREPEKIKTLYSDLKFSSIGMEVNYVD